MSSSRNAKVSRFLLCCLLLCAAGAAAAVTRDVRMHGPNGDGGGCADPDTTAPAQSDSPTKTPAPAVHHASKIKPVVGVHGGGSDDTATHAPRWHSFLPGMFR